MNWGDPHMISFTLVPKEQYAVDCNSNEFFIEMTYGELRPRLVTNVKNPSFFSRMLATTRSSDGYRDHDQSVWRIEKVQLGGGQLDQQQIVE